MTDRDALRALLEGARVALRNLGLRWGDMGDSKAGALTDYLAAVGPDRVEALLTALDEREAQASAQAGEIERLREGLALWKQTARKADTDLDIAQSGARANEATVRDWIKANGHGGWIDDLRATVEAVRGWADTPLDIESPEHQFARKTVRALTSGGKCKTCEAVREAHRLPLNVPTDEIMVEKVFAWNRTKEVFAAIDATLTAPTTDADNKGGDK